MSCNLYQILNKVEYFEIYFGIMDLNKIGKSKFEFSVISVYFAPFMVLKLSLFSP